MFRVVAADKKRGRCISIPKHWGNVMWCSAWQRDVPSLCDTDVYKDSDSSEATK